MPTGPRFEGGRRQAWREDQAAKRGQQRSGTPGHDQTRDDRPRDEGSTNDRPARDRDDRYRDDRYRDERPRGDRSGDDRLNDDRPRDFASPTRGEGEGTRRGPVGRGEPGRFTGQRDRPVRTHRPDRGPDRAWDDRAAETGWVQDDLALPGRGDEADIRRDGPPDERFGGRGGGRDAGWNDGRTSDDRPAPWGVARDRPAREGDREFSSRRDAPRRDWDERPPRSAGAGDRPREWDRDRPARPDDRDDRAGQFRGRADRGALHRDDRATTARPDDRWQGDRQDRPLVGDAGFSPVPDRVRSRDESRWDDRPAPRRDTAPGGPGGDRSPSPRDARYFQGRTSGGGGDRGVTRDPGAGPARPEGGAPDRPRLPRSARTSGNPKADADALLARLGVAEANFADQYAAVQIYARKAGKSLPNGLRSDLRRRGLLSRRGNGRPMESASLADVRAHIDRVDRQLVELLVERGAYVAQAARFKADAAAVEDPDRVETVISNARRHAEGWAADPGLVEDLYRVMLPVFIAHEHDAQRDTSALPTDVDDLDQELESDAITGADGITGDDPTDQP